MNPKLAALIASLSALGALLTFWPQLRPVIDWGFSNVGLWLTYRQTQAVILSVLLGSALSFFVPYYLPNQMAAETSRRHMIQVAAVISFGVAWYMVPTFEGAVWAIIAGLAGWPTVRAAIAVVFRLLPEAKPESLE